MRHRKNKGGEGYKHIVCGKQGIRDGKNECIQLYVKNLDASQKYSIQ